MGILEQVIKMKSQGMPDDSVVNSLREQGIPPKQISDALNQAKIKNAVSNQENYPDMNEMQPSILGGGADLQAPTPEDSEDRLPNLPQRKQNRQNIPQQEFYQPQQQVQEQAYPQDYPQQNYPQESYPGQEFYQPQQQVQESYQSYQSSTDTMIDVAEQVFEEKISELRAQLQNINELKALMETRMDYVEKRLERIESIMDRLQTSILQKIGSYGENLDSIKNEMSMMQDSFSKVVNPMVQRSSGNSGNRTSMNNANEEQGNIQEKRTRRVQ